MSNKRIIPLFNSPDFKQSIVLDGTAYVIRIQWNTVGEFWTMSIYDGNETLIRAGIKLVQWFPLLKQYNDAGLPPGDFVVVDTSKEANLEIGRNDFESGRKVQLWYVGVSE